MSHESLAAKPVEVRSSEGLGLPWKNDTSCMLYVRAVAR